MCNPCGPFDHKEEITMAYRVPLMRPYLNDSIRKRVLSVLESGYWTEGPVTRELEVAFAEYIECRQAHAVTSCTTGLEAALRALEIGPGDEVIVPDFTYPATASVVLLVGATAVFVDVDPETMLIDYEAIEEAITPRTRALLPVSQFGNPLDYQKLRAIAERHALAIVEDAACAMGATYQGKPVGTQADISVFSLHPRKFITTGEGGMITLNDESLGTWLHSYKHFGMAVDGDRLTTHFEIPGTNYKLSNILAAIGLEQMKEIDELLARRRALAQNYHRLLDSETRVRRPVTTPGGEHSYQSYCLFVDERDRVLGQMREAGIEVQIGTYALHQHRAFARGPLVRHLGTLENSTACFESCLVLPLFDGLTQKQQEDVVAELKKAL
jgi:dTDP-4-amino-4,6-dideoxygalactose transaminase